MCTHLEYLTKDTWGTGDTSCLQRREPLGCLRDKTKRKNYYHVLFFNIQSLLSLKSHLFLTEKYVSTGGLFLI
jgi:hypothetical protein